MPASELEELAERPDRGTLLGNHHCSKHNSSSIKRNVPVFFVNSGAKVLGNEVFLSVLLTLQQKKLKSPNASPKTTPRTTTERLLYLRNLSSETM